MEQSRWKIQEKTLSKNYHVNCSAFVCVFKPFFLYVAVQHIAGLSQRRGTAEFQECYVTGFNFSRNDSSTLNARTRLERTLDFEKDPTSA